MLYIFRFSDYSQMENKEVFRETQFRMTTFVPSIKVFIGTSETQKRQYVRLRMCSNQPISQRAKQLFVKQQNNPLMDISQLNLEQGLSSSQINANALPISSTLSEERLQAMKLIMKVATDDKAIIMAKKAVLSEHIGITEPGGALYPEDREKACWRDLKCFLRDIGLFCAGGKYSEDGAQVIKEVYSELKVPLEAVKTGLNAMQKVIEIESEWNEAVMELVNEAFERLEKMIGVI